MKKEKEKKKNEQTQKGTGEKDKKKINKKEQLTALVGMILRGVLASNGAV